MSKRWSKVIKETVNELGGSLPPPIGTGHNGGPALTETGSDKIAPTEDDEPYLDTPAIPPSRPKLSIAAAMDKAVEEALADEDAVAGTRRVTVVEDHHLEFPDLFLDIFVAGPKWEEAAFAAMFARSGCSRAKSVLEADLVVFVGGVDVDPQLYGEKPHPQTDYPDSNRDDTDMRLYLMCLENGIPMLGICRGAQFLHVMNGGKLYQHVDNHYGDHSIYDCYRKELVPRVSSVHHQMCMKGNPGMEIIATSNKATKRWRNGEDTDHGQQQDVEAFFYRDSCAIGIQGHPEYKGYNHFAKWTLDLINDLVVMNPDVDWVGPTGSCHRRLKPELIKSGLKQTATLALEAKAVN